MNADTIATNLSNADLTGAKDIQYTFPLSDTLSVHNAIWPDGSRGSPNPNLVLNGFPQCNNNTSSTINGWIMSGDGQMNIVRKWGKCVFALSLASTGSKTNMTQQIHLA